MRKLMSVLLSMAIAAGAVTVSTNVYAAETFSSLNAGNTDELNENRQESDIEFTYFKEPGVLTEGESYSLQAQVTSYAYTISYAAGIIYKSDNITVMYDAKTNPNSKYFDFAGSEIDRELRFDLLPPGDYILRLSAKDTNGKVALKKREFCVAADSSAKKESDIKFTRVSAPANFTEGEFCSINAEVESGAYKITYAAGAIYETAGYNKLHEVKAHPDSYYFSFADSEINDLPFDELQAGSYVLRLSAQDSNGETVIKKLDFTVYEGKKDSDIKFISVTAPDELTEGDSFALKAAVQSQNYKIAAAKGEIIDSDGWTVYEKIEYPDSYGFNYAGSSVSGAMAFEELSAGEYTLILTATDENGSEAVKSIVFTIKEAKKNSDIKFTSVTAPNELTEGDSFALKAAVQSQNYKITTAKGEIIDSEGWTVYEKTEYPDSYGFNYAGSSVSGAMAFEELSAGEYTLILTATDENGSEAVKSIVFTIKEAKKNSDIKFTSVTAPNELTEGDSFALKATVQSQNYKITAAKGEIIDSDGWTVYEKTEYPDSYDFIYAGSSIIGAMAFEELSAGEYTLILTATDENGGEAVKSIGFTVKETKKDSDIKFTSIAALGELTEGDSFALRAIVESMNYEISYAAASIVDEDGSTVFEKSVNPYAYHFDFSDSKIAGALKFDELMAGEYTLRLTAKDSNGGAILKKLDFSVTKEINTEEIDTNESDIESDIRFISASSPQKLNKGQSYRIKAKVESETYKISYAAGSIINADGTTLFEEKTNPYAYSFDFTGSEIADALRFEELPAGEYTLRLSAKDSNGGVALKMLDFTITETSKKDSDIKFVSASSVPSITKGSSYTISAKVSSGAYKITYAAGALINSKGKTIRTRNTTPNSNSFDFGGSTINEELKFNDLGVGKYKLRLSAKDSNGKVVIKFLNFTVKGQSEVTFTSYTAPPKEMPQGQKFDVDATVTSSSDKIAVVSGKILASDGSEVFSGSFKPNAKSFSFKGSNIDKALKFDKLAPGKYTLRLAVKTAGSKKSFVKKSSFTITAVNAEFTGEWYWPLPTNKRKYNDDSFNSWRQATNNRHQGIDISVVIGTPVYAASPGTVYKTGRNHSSMGNYICIKHGEINGKYIYTTYMHLSQINVKVGQKVDQNSLIGLSGNSGNVPAHLHFHIFQSDNPNIGVSPAHKTKNDVTNNYINPAKIEYKYIHHAV